MAPDAKGRKAMKRTIGNRPNYLSSILPLAAVMAAGEARPGKRTIRITGERHRPIPKGCKVWEYEGIKIIALNEKNAMKKATKIREWIAKHKPTLKEKPKTASTLKAQPKSNLKGSATLKR